MEIKRTISAILLGLALATPIKGSSAEPDPEYLRHVYSAGHKALFMCSGVFVAGRTPAQIRANEFAYAGNLFDAPADAEPDYATKSAIGTALGGRIQQRAVYRDGLGCTLLKPGAKADDAVRLSAPDAGAGDKAVTANWPDGDLNAEGSLPAGANRDKFAAAVSGMFDGKAYGDPKYLPRDPKAPKDTKTIGIAVLHKGRVIAERYSDGWGPHTQGRTYSAAKSITSALVGVRVRQGALAVDAPVNFPEWKAGDPRRRITLRHLLNMSSGLNCSDGEPDGTLNTYFGGGVDAASFAASHAYEHAPGSHWCYSNYDTIMLARAIRFSFPSLDEYLTFPRRELFGRIGMRDTIIETDPFGNFIGSSQIWTTPRDLARFGLLYLNDGVWNGERILPEGWVEFSRTPAPAPVPDINRKYHWGYGAQFWLFHKNPRIPADTYTAAGNGGTYVTIIPARDLVIVRLGLTEVRYEDFVEDVVDALFPVKG